jgi:hypothetical protein
VEYRNKLYVDGLGYVRIKGRRVRGQWFVDVAAPKPTTVKQERHITWLLLPLDITSVRFHWKGKVPCLP